MKSLNWILPLAITAAFLSSCTHRSATDTVTLKAFKALNESIVRSNALLDERIRRITILIESEKRNRPEKVDELLDTLWKVHKKSADIDTYIKGLIAELNKSENDGDVSGVSSLLAKGNDGSLLKAKLETYANDIDGLMSTYRLPAKIPIDISATNTEEGRAASSWQIALFSNTPKIAAITILNKFDGDVKNTEVMCLERLAKESVAAETYLDRFRPLVSAKSNYIHVGEKYEALIGLCAYGSSVADPQIYVSDQKIEVKDGQGLYSVKANALGAYTIPVIIKVYNRRFGTQEIKSELKYTVGK